MAQIQPFIRIELDPRRPVPEICSVISAVTSTSSAEQEELILRGIQRAIEKRLIAIGKGEQPSAEQV